MIINLSKTYQCVFGVPNITQIDSDIFKIKYYSNCMKCDFCNDICCSYGVDIDITNIERLMKHKDAIEKYTNIKAENWFTNHFVYDDEYPGGKYTRTKVENNSCIFLDRNNRGCLIHSYCVNNNLDFHELKPLIGCLFPLTFAKGLLQPSNEIKEKSLKCLNQGITLYEGTKNDLCYYFGQELINELDNLKITIQIAS